MIQMNYGFDPEAVKKLLKDAERNTLKRATHDLVASFFIKDFNRKEAIGDFIMALNLGLFNDEKALREKEKVLKSRLLTVLKPTLRIVRLIEVELDEFIERIHNS